MTEERKLSQLQQEHAPAGEKGWVIIEPYPTMERQAASEVRRKGLRAYVPHITHVRKHHRTGEPIIKRQPSMRGYFFGRFPDGVPYDDLQDCWGVKRILKMPGTDQPWLIRHQVIAAIMRAERQMQHEAEDARVYRMGRRRGLPATINRAVTQAIFGSATRGLVVSGAFINHLVELAGITDAGKVLGRVVIMGKESVKEFDPVLEIIPEAA
jgi:hypothetical protein